MTAKRAPTIAVARRYWRMLAPKWAHDPLSGAGAAARGGRLNPPGLSALYMSEDFATAVAEYEQDLGIRPGTLCAYEVTSERIADLGDIPTLEALGVDGAILKSLVETDRLRRKARVAELGARQASACAKYRRSARPFGSGFGLQSRPLALEYRRRDKSRGARSAARPSRRSILVDARSRHSQTRRGREPITSPYSSKTGRRSTQHTGRRDINGSRRIDDGRRGTGERPAGDGAKRKPANARRNGRAG